MAGSDETELAMAPMEWFKHKSKARTDFECRRLIQRCGMRAYGRWWALCELMAEKRGHQLPFVTDEDVADVCRELWMGDEPDERDRRRERASILDECRGFVSTLADLDLIDAESLEHGVIHSERMTRNALEIGQRRRAGKGNAKGDL